MTRPLRSQSKSPDEVDTPQRTIPGNTLHRSNTDTLTQTSRNSLPIRPQVDLPHNTPHLNEAAADQPVPLLSHHMRACSIKSTRRDQKHSERCQQARSAHEEQKRILLDSRYMILWIWYLFCTWNAGIIGFRSLSLCGIGIATKMVGKYFFYGWTRGISDFLMWVFLLWM